MNDHICTESLNALEYALQGSTAGGVVLVAGEIVDCSTEGFLDRYTNAELESLRCTLYNKLNVILSDIITALKHIEKTPIENIAELLEKNRLLQNAIAVLKNVQDGRKRANESGHLFDLCKEGGS